MCECMHAMKGEGGREVSAPALTLHCFVDLRRGKVKAERDGSTSQLPLSLLVDPKSTTQPHRPVTLSMTEVDRGPMASPT